MNWRWSVAAIAIGLTSFQVCGRDMMQYGRAYLAEGDNVAAVQSFTDLLKQNPFDPVALNNLAVAKAAIGDYRAALDLLKRAERLAPNRQDIRENLSSLQSWMEKNDGVAIAMMERPRFIAPRTEAVLAEPPALWPTPARKAGATPMLVPSKSR
jgi:tetratricopeptide (TPR) repeat protein